MDDLSFLMPPKPPIPEHVKELLDALENGTATWESDIPEQRSEMGYTDREEEERMAYLGTLMTRRAEVPYQCPDNQQAKI